LPPVHPDDARRSHHPEEVGRGQKDHGSKPSERRTTQVKTLAIRLEDDAHARLALLSKLGGLSITDTIRTAIDGHLAALAAQPDIAAKAEALTSEIEREAAEQRSAIQALLGSSKSATRQPKG
jgi:hypothetical protein